MRARGHPDAETGHQRHPRPVAVFSNAVAGKRADFIGNPDVAHTYSYVPDVVAGLVTLGTDERAVGQVWHLSGPETVTTGAVFGAGGPPLATAIGDTVAWYKTQAGAR